MPSGSRNPDTESAIAKSAIHKGTAPERTSIPEKFSVALRTETPNSGQRANVLQQPGEKERNCQTKRATKRVMRYQQSNVQERAMTGKTTESIERDGNVRVLKAMVRGAYDLQELRMQSGLRLCANFRARLGLGPKPSDGQGDAEIQENSADNEEDDEDARKIIDHLRASYRRLTDGIARNRTLPAEKGFTGDELIATYSELVLVEGYFALEKMERGQFGHLEFILDKIPIYQRYLAAQRGIGPAMAGVIISSFDPHEARHVSSFWKYAGLDVGPDGRGRSRREAHLVERRYRDRAGKLKTRLSITYDPWVKSKMMGVLAGSMLRLASPWRREYDSYRHRIESDPARIKLSIAEWKERRAAGEDDRSLWPPARIHMAASRYMIKMFLLELWTTWRELEGLPVTPSYHEARLGHAHCRDRPAA